MKYSEQYMSSVLDLDVNISRDRNRDTNCNIFNFFYLNYVIGASERSKCKGI